jgi:DNA-nicking Smr family endonuclease
LTDEKRPRRSRWGRDLNPEERALWDKVAETIKPLPGRKKTKRAEPLADGVPAKKNPPAAKPAPPAAAAPIAAKPKPPLAPLEPKLARTLKRGGEVDARFDLHGYRQDEAHSKLLWFLKSQRTRGARIVLVITGKSGVLNRAVPLWLAEPSLRDVVIGFSQAATAHGGAGAMYVRLRRDRER